MTARRVFVAMLAACLMLSGCGFTGLYSATWLPGGASTGSHPYTVNIQFADVLDLVPQSAVKVNDVPVGKVDKIKLAATNVGGKRTWVASVQVTVRGNVHLPANARADIEQTSLLGEKYVSLSPPSGEMPTGTLHKDSSIPLSRTSSAFEVEQVLGALSLLLNEGGLTQIRAIAGELNKALGTTQRQQAVRDLLGQLTTFTGTLNRGRDDITTALANIDKLAASLNANKKVITDALDTYPAALKVLKNDEPKLVTLLTSLSKLGTVATNVINASQTQLTTALKALDPVLLRLTGAGDALPGALRIAGTFPFPLGLSRQFVRGDYANLDAVLDLNLNDQLCTLLGLCVSGAKSLLGGLKLPLSDGKAKAVSGATSGATTSGSAKSGATTSGATKSSGAKTDPVTSSATDGSAPNDASSLPIVPGAGR